MSASALVVGAGPTGLTLTNILGQAGVPTILIERRLSTVDEPRAVSIDDESLRTVQSVNLHEQALEDIVPGYGVHYYTRPGGRCFAKVEPTVKQYGFPKRNAFRQPLFERTLLLGLRRYACVQILFGCELLDFQQNDAGVRAQIRRPNGDHQTLEASYLIGSDGGRSMVRKAIGAALRGTSFQSRWLIVDTEEDDDTFWQTRVYCDPRRPIVEVPGPHRTRRFEFMLKPYESESAMLEPEVLRDLLRPFRGDKPTNVVRKTVYPFHARVADRWRAGRVFIAGDAAHLTPPYAGQGMNSGIRDAHNLGWKLAAVINGRCGKELLDTYEVERRDHAWALIRLALNLGIVMAPASKIRAVLTSALLTMACCIPPLRSYLMQMRFKPKPRFKDGIVIRKHGDSLAGTMFPQPRVQSSDGRINLLDDLIGPNFCLIQLGGTRSLACLSHPLWMILDARRIYIAPKDIPVGPSHATIIAVQDIDDGLSSLFALQPGKIVLLRPDRYVAAVFSFEEQNQVAERLVQMMGLASTNSQPLS
ncbi:MAG: bifunctional 3-(3-hydroxy-phenyl)propionate/3-hydroxycinnamic acid hydroxylase [Pseudomonadota bacterium]|nr:bifunctional 3-(3-hydroxy-phenyl)propionate/3-hydroxycinnamic acid hydroxylase [Pseudomonadota bacterium]